MSETAAPITLSSTQNCAFQHIDKMLLDMEPLSDADSDTDINDIDENIVSYFPFNIYLHDIACIISCQMYLTKFYNNSI